MGDTIRPKGMVPTPISIDEDDDIYANFPPQPPIFRPQPSVPFLEDLEHSIALRSTPIPPLSDYDEIAESLYRLAMPETRKMDVVETTKDTKTLTLQIYALNDNRKAITKVKHI